MKRPSAVLDTNVVVSGLIVPKSKPGHLISAWKRNLFQLVTSAFLLHELEFVLKRPIFLNKYSLKTTSIDAFVARMARRSLLVENVQSHDVPLRDPKDIIVLATALDGKSDFLVSGDKDLLALKQEQFPHQLQILTVNEFLKQLEGAVRSDLN
ncbi:MAG: putative toxin-antitoxin system toxin component, PIN family [Patescibacteria group bacterium]